VQTDFSSHTKPDFMASLHRMQTASLPELQYFHKDGLSARFLCFYPKARRCWYGYAYFSQDGKTDIIYAPAAMPGNRKTQPRFWISFPTQTQSFD
jgi:hypothetical protein